MKDKKIEIGKPVKAKPRFYAVSFLTLMLIAKEKGYNLLISGSLDRDFDLVAVPWVDSPAPHLELLQSFSAFLGVGAYDNIEHYLFSILPGGRSSYVINLCRVDLQNHTDPQYYLDISITPLSEIKEK